MESRDDPATDVLRWIHLVKVKLFPNIYRDVTALAKNVDGIKHRQTVRTHHGKRENSTAFIPFVASSTSRNQLPKEPKSSLAEK